MPRWLSLPLALLICGCIVGPASAASLQIGFVDGTFSGASADRDVWLDQAKIAGADFIRVDSGWSGVAPKEPANPTDPADPAYRWTNLDNAVIAATARGLDIVVAMTGAPTWAQGADKPATAANGTWRPNPDAYGQFARALAKRYSGAYNGLPRVDAYEPWNEVNLDKYLTPQWTRASNGTFQAASPDVYRGLLNAFYAGVKAEAPGALIVAGGTAPFGDPEPGGSRIQPVLFYRDLLCVSATLKRTPGCSDPAHFDVIDHHPYSVRGPFAPAANADDVSVPDMGKISRLVSAAVRNGTALPRATKQLWAMEVSWDSSPPDPDGVPAAMQADWMQQAFYELARQGVRRIGWYRLRDQAPTPSYATTYQSGPFLLDGTAKPSATAYRFPFVVLKAGKGRVRYWGMAPAVGSVVIERAVGSGWKAVRTVRASSITTPFAGTLKLRGTPTLRARQGTVVSLSGKPASTSAK